MKKIIIPLLALGLIACQADTTESHVNNETNEKNEISETNETNENKEVKEGSSVKSIFKKVDLNIYDEVIDNYAALTEMSQEEAENASLEGVKIGAYEYFYNGNVFEAISVTYHDINEDGVEELLIALRSGLESYALIDLYTIVDGEVISLFTDEMSASVTYKRSGISLLENGNLIYATASGQGDRYGTIYELKDETMEYVETYDVSLTEGDFDIIEKELENVLDVKALDWKSIGKEKEKTAYDNFMKGDLSAIEGIWENGYDNEGSQVRIEGNKMTYQDGGHVIMDFTKEYSDEESSAFNLMEEDGIGGSLLYFYPESSEIEFGDVSVPSDVKQDRFFVTQTDPPDEKGIYYKVSDLED